ncbi:MAG: hypothetical protein JST01_23730 [Cyanobacteria bacterium SZAS TMP-1]|nr:hypothetical protein [Cyanobacteria bacterium SZAS TMP-1]
MDHLSKSNESAHANPLSLPNIDVLQLLGDSHGRAQVLQGAQNLSCDLAQGAGNEIAHNQVKVAGCFTAGLAAAGLAVALPEVAFVVGVGGAAIGAYEIYKHSGEWLHSAQVVADPSRACSVAESRVAHKQVQAMGAEAVDLAAGAAGGLCGGLLASARRQAIENASTKAFPRLAHVLEEKCKPVDGHIKVERTPIKDALNTVKTVAVQTYRLVQSTLEAGQSFAAATGSTGDTLVSNSAMGRPA